MNLKALALCLTLLSSPLAVAGDWTPHGFFDARYGARTGTDPYERDTSLAEGRLQLELGHQASAYQLQLRADALYDDLAGDHGEIDLDGGETALDLREAWLSFSLSDTLDVKLGRQILTWGSGDLIFINDLFAKDWNSFFSGRDTEYLKAPSDALMLSWFPGDLALDLVYLPRFGADRYIDGSRFSLYNPLLARRSGRDAVLDAIRPDDAFDEDELALRFSGNRNGIEWALYGYDGYWKSPAGFDAASGRPIFPALRVLGASVRMPLGKGLANAETGIYDSRDDRDGSDPFLPNSEWRALLGYERELARNLTLGLQAYLEHLQDEDAYRASLPPGAPARDRDRTLLTARLTRRLHKDDLTLSLFVFHSPSDHDGYARPAISYKLNDSWLLTAGGNHFWGEQQHTFFGQFEDNSNLYAGARWTF